MKTLPPCHYINEQLNDCSYLYIGKGVLCLNKKLIKIPIMVAMSFSLVGCGTNGGTANQERNRHSIQPVGYYSNENHYRNRGGNARIFDGADNDGPIIDILDYSFGLEGENYRNGRKNRPIRTSRRDITSTNVSNTQNTQFSRADYNYHGHLGDNTRKVESNQYYVAYDGKLVEEINRAVANVKNVDDVQTVVHGNNVLIAVNLANTSNERNTIAEIKRTIQPLLQGKTSRITTDASTFSRLLNIDSSMRDWGPKDQTYSDLDNLFRTNQR